MLLSRGPRAALLALGAICAAGRAAAAEPLPYSVAPAPAWALPIEADDAAPIAEGAARDGVVALLADRQVRVSEGTVERYVHVARKIVSKGGIEEASELTFDIDPPHEALVLHHVRILRDGRAEDALRPKELHVIQKESDLSQRMYVGTLSIMAFLHDVRAGDVIDYAYSINGWNPVLGPRFATTLLLGAPAPTRRLRVRLLTPRARSFTFAPRGALDPPAERDLGDMHETLWDRRDVPSIAFEDRTPRWFNPFPRVEVTEYPTWADVAAWALPLYPPVTSLPPSLAAEVEKIRAAAPDDKGRLLAALHFVQDDIRYLGIELGESSHRPESPAVVLERRFGDCKDKTRLLVTLLQALGIKARPALVNPDLGRGLDERAPSPLAFNHVITMAEIGGRAYFLDPTLTGQRGGLDALESPDYERALLIGPGTAGLTPIPLPARSEPSVEEIEEIQANRYDAPALVTVTTRYRGRAADGMRREVDSTDRAELSRQYLNYYAQGEPSVTEDRPPAIDDDPVKNTLTIVERYKIPDFWSTSTKSFSARLISDALHAPRISRRTMPLAVSHPTLLAHETRLLLPEAFPVDPSPVDLGDDAVSLHCTSSSPGTRVSIRCRYETKRDFVPPAEVAAHLALVDKMRSSLGYELTRSEARKGNDDLEGVLWIGGFVATVGLVVGAGGLVSRFVQGRRKRAYDRKRVLDRGEAPSTAVTVRSRAQMIEQLLATRCACGARPRGQTPDVETATLRFGDRTLTSARTICPACGQPRTRFFDLQA